MTGIASRRADIFVSIGLIGTKDEPVPADELAALVRAVDARFRYWELLFVADADDVALQDQLLAATRNMRLIKVRPGTPGYRRRLCIVNEAIGDILIISGPEELGQVDLLALIDQCEASESMITLRRPKGAWLTAPIAALGRGAGFRVDSRDMVTTAFPRAVISRLLKHSDAPLAVRFPPMDRNVPVQVQLCETPPRARPGSSIGKTFYRLGILQQIVVSSAPKILSLVMLLSLLVSFAAILFAAYAVTVWLTFARVQPGWFTTSMLLGMTAMFLGLAIFGVSIGIQRLLDLSSTLNDDDVLDEVNSIDLFGSAAAELNIEIDDQRAGARPA